MGDHDAQLEDTQLEGQIGDDSDKLLEAVAELRRLEKEKRRQELSSPAFHALANEVEQKSRAVFRGAVEERIDGDKLSSRRGTTIDEITHEDGAARDGDGRHPGERDGAGT